MLRLSTQSISWINSDINSSIVVKRVKTYSWSETTEKNTLTERTSYLYHQFNGFCSCSHTLALIPNVGRKNLSAEIQVWEKSTAFRKYARENPSQRTMTSNICKFSRHFYPEKGWKNGIAFFLYSLHFNWMQATHKQFIIYSNDYGIFSITRKKTAKLVAYFVSVMSSNQTSRKNGYAKIFAAGEKSRDNKQSDDFNSPLSRLIRTNEFDIAIKIIHMHSNCWEICIENRLQWISEWEADEFVSKLMMFLTWSWWSHSA